MQSWSMPRQGRFSPRKESVPTVEESVSDPGPVWTGADNLAATGIRPHNRSARIESLYRLSYLGPLMSTGLGRNNAKEMGQRM